jgi:hypothetical protein
VVSVSARSGPAAVFCVISISHWGRCEIAYTAEAPIHLPIRRCLLVVASAWTAFHTEQGWLVRRLAFSSLVSPASTLVADGSPRPQIYISSATLHVLAPEIVRPAGSHAADRTCLLHILQAHGLHVSSGDAQRMIRYSKAALPNWWFPQSHRLSRPGRSDNH